MEPRCENKTLREVFVMSNLAIPENQREYVWDQKEIEILMNDLHSNMLEGQSSFLGTLCFSEAEGKVFIVDGQQRITTFGILLDILMKRIGLRKTEIAVPEFVEKIVKKGSTKSFVTIASCVADYVSDEGLFLNYLLEGVSFVVLYVDEEDQCKVFDSINGSGKALEIQELVYQELFTRTKDEEGLSAIWNEFLDFMEGAEREGAILSSLSEEELFGTEEEERSDETEEEASAEEGLDGANEEESVSVNDAEMKLRVKRLNYSHFFSVFVRLDQNRKYNRDVFRALCERFQYALEEKKTEEDDGIYLAKYLLQCARYYALFVNPLEHLGRDWFANRFLCPKEDKQEAFVCALTRFSTLHMGDALPVMMRLVMRENVEVELLTAYLDAIFNLVLLANVTQNTKLKRAVLRRLLGLEDEVKQMPVCGKTMAEKVQITLIGTMWNWYKEAYDALGTKLRRLRYQGNASAITSLLVAELTQDNIGLEKRILQLTEVYAKGGFSVEHIIPQSKKKDFDIQLLGNLVLLERDLNSAANAKDIQKKKEIYAGSRLEESIFKVIDDMDCEDVWSWIKKRTECMSKMFEEYFANKRLQTIPEQNKNKYLVYLKENPSERKRTWVWEWTDSTDREEEEVFYYDNGKNSRKMKNMNAIMNIHIGKPHSMNKNKIVIPSCTEILLFLLWENLRQRGVTLQNYRKAIELYARPEQAEGYGNYISTEPILHNAKEDKDAKTPKKICFEDKDGLSEEVEIFLSSQQSNYAPSLNRYFKNVLEELGIDEAVLEPVYIEYEKPAFREDNASYYSKYARMYGNKESYMAVLKQEAKPLEKQPSQVILSTEGREWSEIVSGQIKTLKEIAEEYQKIRVPMYQRKYVWTEKEWSHLRKSILDTEAEGKGFFGIVLLGEKEENGDLVYELIDGQQRLTTLSYLFPDLELKNHISFHDSKVDKFFNDGTERYMELSEYAANQDAFSNEKAQEMQFLVLTLKREHIARAGELFSLINGRGRRLTPGEIIKNYILMNIDELICPQGREESDKKKVTDAYLKNARKMWKDSAEFEKFIKAYLDMARESFVKKADMVNTIRNMEKNWNENVINREIARRWDLDVDYIAFLRFIADKDSGGLFEKRTLQLAEVIAAEAGASTTQFFTEMPQFWDYYKILTTKLSDKDKKELDRNDKEQLRLYGELYLHGLTGTHTTWPSLLYHYSCWERAKGTQAEEEKKEIFYEVLRRYTDAFLICHLCGYENSLKSMDKRLVKYCKPIEKEKMEEAFSMNGVFGVDSSATPRKSLKDELDKDLYGKRKDLALLLLWRCEQIVMGEEKAHEFYKKICSVWGKAIPSVEHIRPQAENTFAISYVWNYTLLEKDKNSKAGKAELQKKREIYDSSTYEITKMLGASSAQNGLGEEELKSYLRKRMVEWLCGENGLFYLRARTELE